LFSFRRVYIQRWDELKLHSGKTTIVNLLKRASARYPKKYDFLGFTIKSNQRIHQGKATVMPGGFVSSKGIFANVRKLCIEKGRNPLGEVKAPPFMLL